MPRSTGVGSDERHGVLRRALARLTSSDEELEAAELREDVAEAGATPIAELHDRQRVCVSGTLRAVTLRPRAGVPALEAELYDGTGALAIVWLGRRRIPGISCGRQLVAEGLVSSSEGRPVLFNPRYELRAGVGE